MSATFQRLRAGDLMVILSSTDEEGNQIKLQRKETPKRILSLRREWNEAYAGVLYVARLTDGPYAGTLHPWDGGTRFYAWTDEESLGDEFPVDLDHEFDCKVEDMTQQAVSDCFVHVNKNRKAIPKLDEYLVSLTAGEAWALALREALQQHDLVPASSPYYGNGTNGKMAAIAACEAAILAATKNAGGDWSVGAAHLAHLLGITRTAFRPVSASQDGVYAHDGDLIRSVSRVVLANSDKLPSTRGDHRLMETLRSHAPSTWKMWSNEGAEQGNTAGGQGRVAWLAARIVHEYNKRLGEARRLKNPTRSVIDL